MQMIQDGPYASAPEKPLRMSGGPESCRVCYYCSRSSGGVVTLCVFATNRKRKSWCHNSCSRKNWR